MKHFFSIFINHDYDRVSDKIRGVSNDLSIVPASTNELFSRNNRLWFRSQTGGLICYIEDDETLKSETDMLFFWVVCINESFYSYTDYPNHINFSNPYYYWSNSQEQKSLQQDKQCHLHPGKPPKQAVGCIGISIRDIETSKKLEFNVDFKERKTFWEYHIMINEDPKEKKYEMIDLDFSQCEDNPSGESDTIKKEEWVFEKISDENASEIIFQSKIPLPYKKKARKCLQLEWGPKQESPLEDNQKMILPFANYKYKTVNKDNKELTPIYIHI